MENNYLNIGYILKTRGLKGVLKVKSATHFSALRYKKGNKLYLFNQETNARIEVIVNSYSNEGEFDYVSFLDYLDINLVEKFIGWIIQVNRSEIPPLDDGNYFYCDLEGLKCYDENSKKEFGVVKKVEDFTSQISLRVQLLNTNKTILIPFVKAFCKNVDLENKTITFTLIDGMLDL